MDDTLTKILNIIPPKWHATVLLLLALSPYLGRAYHAVTNGGGIRGIWSSIWFGTNTPKQNQTENKPT